MKPYATLEIILVSLLNFVYIVIVKKMKRSTVVIVGCVSVALLILVIILATTMSSSSPKAESSAIAESVYQKDLLKGPLMKFTLKLFQSWQLNDEKNLIISPLSLANGFSMLLVGAGKQSKDQIFNSFYFNEAVDDVNKLNYVYRDLLEQIESSNDNNNGSIVVRNRIFVDDNFKIKTNYQNKLEKFYRSEVAKVDFKSSGQESIDLINNWISKSSKGQISKLFDKPLDESTKLVLLNVIFFKRFWLKPFDEDNTSTRKFLVSENQAINITTMFNLNKYRFSMNPGLKYSIIELQYEQKNLNCYVILPDIGNKLTDLISNLTIEDIERSIDEMKLTEIQLFLPKFKTESELDLKEPLGKLGIVDVFTESADLSGISEYGQLRVTKSLHKSVIDFSEKGTEGSAATAIAIEGRSGRISRRFEVNRPFMFLIRDSVNGVIYFAGRVYKPQ